MDRQLDAVGGGGYCRLQMPSKLALAIGETVAGHRLGALEGGGGTTPTSNASTPPSCRNEARTKPWGTPCAMLGRSPLDHQRQGQQALFFS